MKSNLSQSFYGSKKFLEEQYQTFKVTKTITNEQIKTIFQPYTSKLDSIRSQDNTTTLLPIFCEFIRGNIYKFHNWPVQKLSAWLQISAHVFQHSFEKHLNQKQSFQYFSQVVIRHSLFRPPHSVNVFTYEQAKLIMDYWLSTFVRFYQQYRQCFEAQLNQIMYTVSHSFDSSQDLMQTKKQISRQDFAAKFGKVIQINQVVKKS